MPLERQSVSEEILEEGFGALGGCLVEGDAEQRHRERLVRRRALALSIALQCAILSALVLIPLFGKTERIALGKVYTPIPPYGHPDSHPRGNATRTTSRRSNPDSRFVFHPPTSKPGYRSVEEESPVGPPEIGSGANQPNDGPGCSWCVNTGAKNNGPRPPQPAVETHSRPRTLHVTQLDPAMLIHRVAPLYPPLAIHTHREGRVELHAIIGTDGTIQSLQVLSGDPLFYQSALEAVRQWHYRPTILNGQPVAIDTSITVIYTMPR
jgi:periplasmic protein TonB